MSRKVWQPGPLIGHPCSSHPDRERCMCSLSMLRPFPEPGDNGRLTSTHLNRPA